MKESIKNIYDKFVREDSELYMSYFILWNESSYI